MFIQTFVIFCIIVLYPSLSSVCFALYRQILRQYDSHFIKKYSEGRIVCVEVQNESRMQEID